MQATEKWHEKQGCFNKKSRSQAFFDRKLKIKITEIPQDMLFTIEILLEVNTLFCCKVQCCTATGESDELAGGDFSKKS